MAVSLIDQLAETNRQEATGDNQYFKKGAFVFVIHGPSNTGPLPITGRAQFPLVVNPEVFEYTLPFASQVTPLQEGGVVADEDGIVVGSLRISGTTGFRIRKPLGDTSGGSGDGDFTGTLDVGGKLFNAAASSLGVSGHLHFWRLAGRCFDGYSALKKDPQHAAKTRMEFHSLKDDLHLLIVPKVFALNRTASRERVLYRYDIRADVVGPASETIIDVPSPDEGLLQGMKNTIAKIRGAIQGATAAVNDIIASIDEIRRTISSIAGIIDDVADVLDAFTGIVNGVKKFVDIPKAFISATGDLVESAANFAATTGFPPDVAQSLREVRDNLDRLAVAGRNHFRENFSENSRRYAQLTEGLREGKDPTRDAAAASLATAAETGQGRLSVQSAFGTTVRPGDVVRSRADSLQQRSRLSPGKYRGFEERVVGQGDTLQSLAAKYMGDAREWLAIAIANQLKAPFITNGAPIPGTVQPGSRVIIPIPQTRVDPDTLTTGTRELGASQAESLLGTDLELEKLANGQYAWRVDTRTGSVDCFKISGIDNLGQGLAGRFRTEQGQNILYPAIGIPRVVGNRATLGTLASEEIVDSRYNLRRQLLADRRIDRVAYLNFTLDKDVLSMETNVVPVGFSSARVIQRQLT